jgi:hypothetical protein
MGNLNMSGFAVSAERKNSYALAKRDYELEAYWTGDFGPNGHRKGKILTRAKTSSVRENATAFPDLKAAYAAASEDERLGYFRVVELYPRESTDGFKTRWWMSAS